MSRLRHVLLCVLATWLALGLMAGYCMLGWGCVERAAHRRGPR